MIYRFTPQKSMFLWHHILNNFKFRFLEMKPRPSSRTNQTTTTRSKSAFASTNQQPFSHSKQPTISEIYQRVPRPKSYKNIPIRKPTVQWNQSSSALRYENIQYTIPQDQKLKDPKVNYYDHYKLQFSATLSNRAADIGKGNKVNVPWVFSNKIDDAAVDAPYYEIDDMKLRRNKSSTMKNGKTFSKFYSKEMRQPHRSTVHCPEQVKANPGPNKYETSRVTGSSAQKNKMHERLMMFSELRGHQTMNEPGPQNYKISQQQIRPSTARANFGYSKKSDFTYIPQKINVPSPVYNIPGFCDKFKTTQIKNCGKRK